MKVINLIHELLNCPPEAEVFVYFSDEADESVVDLLIEGIADIDPNEVVLDYNEKRRFYYPEPEGEEDV